MKITKIDSYKLEIDTAKGVLYDKYGNEKLVKNISHISFDTFLNNHLNKQYVRNDKRCCI